MKVKIFVRLGIGRVGIRYKIEIVLRFRVDYVVV